MQYSFENIIYTPENIKDVLRLSVSENDIKTAQNGISYYNIPCAFDIETSSFYRTPETGETFNYYQVEKLNLNKDKLEKIAIMYIWQLGINGRCIIGRTWSEFINTINAIIELCNLNPEKRLIIYVHNLSFEFQFICKLFEWQNVFSIDVRRPLYAVTTNGVEFRCSYLLSGYSLATLAKNLTKYKIEKLTGDLDYHLIRHEKTEITQKELQYCINDIKIVMLYILEYIENVKNILHIPYTKTGGVRKFCRKSCFYIQTDKKQIRNYDYIHLIKSLRIETLTEFNTVHRAFCGGFTHGNALYINETLENVASYDFTSSYPYVMISEKYPLTRGKLVHVETVTQLEKYCNDYLCVFDVEYDNIFATQTFENYISVSKCFVKSNFSENNGRLVCAEKIVLTITNIDYKIIKSLYQYENIKVGKCYVYAKQYLPTEYVKCIIELYKKKTELKGVNGMETEYLNSKEMLNSLYGMCVTNPIRDTIKFDVDGWKTETLNENEKESLLYKENFSDKRFLFYLWGVFVTAYARRNLFTAIFELKNDYVYSDTDSVKFLNIDKHTEYFAQYNKIVEYKLKCACNFHGLKFADCAPYTIKGKQKMLGVWDFEGIYEKFKTLGAKRYLVKEKNVLDINGKSFDFSLTVSGVNKKCAIPYLLKTYGENGIFKAFTNYLKIPNTASGKNILTYIDYETTGEITDYNGETVHFDCLSGVHIEPTEYTLSMSINFLNHILGIKKEFKSN